jgi:hypothetical protein
MSMVPNVDTMVPNGGASSGGGGGGSLTVGTTTISGGTSGYGLYDNSGVLGEAPIRTTLTGNLSLYVNASTGSDSYNGLSATYTGGVNGPTATIQRGVNIAGNNYDYQNLYYPTVNVADGTYNEIVELPAIFACGINPNPTDALACGSVIGNTTTPDNVLLNGGFQLPNGAFWDVEGFKIVGANPAFQVLDYAMLNYNFIDFGAVDYGVICFERGFAEAIGSTLTVSGNISTDLFNGSMLLYGATVTFPNAITIGGSTVNAQLQAFVGLGGATWVNPGNVTGKKFNFTLGAVTDISDLSSIPGSI